MATGVEPVADPAGAPPAARAVEGLAAIEPETWDGLVAEGGAALRHGFLSAWRHAELAGLRSRPVVARAAGSGELVAAAPGNHYELDLVATRSPAIPGPIRALRRLAPRLLFAHVYELGSATPLTNPLLVAPSQRREPAISALLDAAEEERSRAGAQLLLVQNFVRRTGPAAEELARRGFAPVPMLPTAVVHVAWDSFEDYVGAMRSQYRRRVKQAFQRSEALRVEHRTTFGELADEMARLWLAIHDRATELRREVLPAAYFRAVSEVDETSALLLRREDGSIAAFALLLAESPWLWFLQAGFEEDTAHEQGAYFRLLYEIVRVGIEGGFEQVDLGVTTLAPKLDVGGVPLHLFAWIAHRNPLVQRGLRWAAGGPLAPDDVEPRHVFKEPPPSAKELAKRRLPAGA